MIIIVLENGNLISTSNDNKFILTIFLFISNRNVFFNIINFFISKLKLN